MVLVFSFEELKLLSLTAGSLIFLRVFILVNESLDVNRTLTLLPSKTGESMGVTETFLFCSRIVIPDEVLMRCEDACRLHGTSPLGA